MTETDGRRELEAVGVKLGRLGSHGTGGRSDVE